MTATSSFLSFFAFASVILLLKATVSHSKSTLTHYNRALGQLPFDHQDTNHVIRVKSGIYGDSLTLHIAQNDERDLSTWTDDYSHSSKDNKDNKNKHGSRSRFRSHQAIALSSELPDEECRCAYPGERAFRQDTVSFNKKSSRGPKSNKGRTQARHYTTTRDIDHRRGLKGKKSSKNSKFDTNDRQSTPSFDVSRKKQSILPRHHPACHNVTFTCPGTESNLPPWSYSCPIPTMNGNYGSLDTNSRTPGTAWNVLTNGKSGKFHERSLELYQEGTSSITSTVDVDVSALPASNVVLPTNYYLCQCPDSFEKNREDTPNIYNDGFDFTDIDCSVDRVNSGTKYRSFKGKGHRGLRSKSSKNYDSSDSGIRIDCHSLFDTNGLINGTLGGPFPFFDPTCTNVQSLPPSASLPNPTQRFDSAAPAPQNRVQPTSEPIPMANEILSTTFPTTIQTDNPSSQPTSPPSATLTSQPPLSSPPTLESIPQPTMQQTPASVLPITPEPSNTAQFAPPEASSPNESPNAIPATSTVAPGLAVVIPSLAPALDPVPVAAPIAAPITAPVAAPVVAPIAVPVLGTETPVTIMVLSTPSPIVTAPLTTTIPVPSVTPTTLSGLDTGPPTIAPTTSTNNASPVQASPVEVSSSTP